MRILKLINITSFLLITGLQAHSSINFGLLSLALVQLFYDVFSLKGSTSINWEWALVSIITLVALLTFYFCNQFKHRYIMISCFICLMVSIYFLDYTPNFKSLNAAFLIPLSVFILSSIVLIIKSFIQNKNSEAQNSGAFINS